MSKDADLLIKKALEQASRTPPIHIVQYQKSEKVMKLYAVVGNIALSVLVMLLVGVSGAMIWWVFAENLWQLMALGGIGLVVIAFGKACSHYEKHRVIVERAKKEGVIDD